jgi:hypothetical protein
MKIFGKSLGEYIRFQKAFLIAILVVGLLRLILSMAGLPISTVRLFSVTVVVLIGALYYGIQAPRTGFGTYRHLLPLVFLQAVLSNGIAIAGILIAIATGEDNAFSEPEFGGQGAFHVFGHVVFGMGIGSLLSWAISSLAMLVTKKLTRRPAPATS